MTSMKQGNVLRSHPCSKESFLDLLYFFIFVLEIDDLASLLPLTGHVRVWYIYLKSTCMCLVYLSYGKIRSQT